LIRPTLPPPNPSSPGRSDARRNRQRLIAAAAAAFASGDPAVSMNSIARRAGVGSGTLYRHFPTRDDLVEEVYRDQLQQLQTAARELLTSESPAQALRMWMDVFADWAATKYGMRDALSAITASGRIGSGQMHHEFQLILRLFLEAGVEAGDLRPDIDPLDLGAILAGVLTVAGAPDQRAQLHRMLGVVVDGLRPQPRTLI
jgi:AcrR family transcriptional regulator